MKKVLFLSFVNIALKNGGGMATLSYYNAVCACRPGNVDLMMSQEYCVGHFSHAIGMPKRSVLDYFTDCNLHRGKTFIKRYIRDNYQKYDTVVINNGRNAGDMMDYIHKYNLRIIVIHHNFEVEYSMTNKSFYTLGGHFPYIVSYFEGQAYRKADVNCFMTAKDVALFEDYYGPANAEKHILAVYETEHRDFTPSLCSNAKTCLITGSMCTYQTYYSIKKFGEVYMKCFTDVCPDFKIIISGRNPNSVIYDLRDKWSESISVIPNPEDMNEIMDMGAFFICPTCIGGGIKLRVMDGLKKGLPALVHEISARGYEAFGDLPYFQVYNDTQSFIKGLNSIRSFIDNNRDYQNIIINKYKENFSFETGVSRMKKILNG